MIKRVAGHIDLKILFGITVFVTLLMLITFAYVDVASQTVWAIEFWDVFFQGRLDQYYLYTAENIRGAWHGSCGNYIYILPIIIWNLPSWIVLTLCGITGELPVLCIIWAKLEFVVAAYIMAYYVCKICKMFVNFDHKKQIITFLLVVSCPEMLVSIGYAGQDEVIYMCTFVMALYYFMLNKTGAFILLGTISVTLCPIMLIPYLALVLMKEKRIVRILGECSITLIPLVLSGVLSSGLPGYTADIGMESFIYLAFSTTIFETSSGTVSVFAVLLVLIYFYCYSYVDLREQTEEDHQKIVWCLCVLMLCLECFTFNNFYRWFLYVPFLVIIIMTKQGNNQRINLFLTVVLSYIRILLLNVINGRYAINAQYVMKGSLPDMLCNAVGNKKAGADLYLYDYLRVAFPTMDSILPVVGGIMIAVVILLIVINYPGNRREILFPVGSRVSVAFYVMCTPLLMMAFYLMLVI